MVNSFNERYNPHFDYFKKKKKKILKSCNDDLSFNQMLSSINFQRNSALTKKKK